MLKTLGIILNILALLILVWLCFVILASFNLEEYGAILKTCQNQAIKEFEKNPTTTLTCENIANKYKYKNITIYGSRTKIAKALRSEQPAAMFWIKIPPYKNLNFSLHYLVILNSPGSSRVFYITHEQLQKKRIYPKKELAFFIVVSSIAHLLCGGQLHNLTTEEK